jgi:hypothetical protein
LELVFEVGFTPNDRWIWEMVATRSLEYSRYELSIICDNLYRMGGTDHAL